MSAMVIEQSSEDTRLAFEVNQNSSMARICLVKAKLSSDYRAAGATSIPIGVSLGFETRAVRCESGILGVEVSFRMAGMESPGSKRQAKPRSSPVVAVECAFELEYEIREGFRVTPPHANAFRNGNAVFHAWPYFREFLQSSLQRMGLPPFAAPFLRLQMSEENGQAARPHRSGSASKTKTR